MAATMISSVVPAVTSAADAKKGFSIKAYADSDSKYASEGSKVTVSMKISLLVTLQSPALYISQRTHLIPKLSAFSLQ